MNIKENLKSLVNQNKFEELFPKLYSLLNTYLATKEDLVVKDHYVNIITLKYKYKRVALGKDNAKILANVEISNIKKSILLIIEDLPTNFYNFVGKFNKVKKKSFSAPIETKPTDAEGPYYAEDIKPEEIKIIVEKEADKNTENERIKLALENKRNNKVQIIVFLTDFLARSIFLIIYSIFNFSLVFLLILQIIPFIVSYFVIYEKDAGVSYEGMSNLNKYLVIIYILVFSTLVFFLTGTIFWTIISLFMYFITFLTIDYYSNYDETEFLNPYNKKYKL